MAAEDADSVVVLLSDGSGVPELVPDGVNVLAGVSVLDGDPLRVVLLVYEALLDPLSVSDVEADEEGVTLGDTVGDAVEMVAERTMYDPTSLHDSVYADDVLLAA